MKKYIITEQEIDYVKRGELSVLKTLEPYFAPLPSKCFFDVSTYEKLQGVQTHLMCVGRGLTPKGLEVIQEWKVHYIGYSGGNFFCCDAGIIKTLEHLGYVEVIVEKY